LVPRIAMVLAVSLLLIARVHTAAYLLATPLMGSAGLCFIWERSQHRPLPTPIRDIAILVLSAAFGAALVACFRYLLWYHGLWPDNLWKVACELLLAAIALVIALQLRTHNQPVSLVTKGLVATLALIAIWNWDARTPWAKFVETTSDAPASLTSLLPGKEPIYWEGDVRVPWFVLKRANYFSCTQGTGAMFFRPTAVAYQQRYETFTQMPTLDLGESKACPSPLGMDPASFVRANLATICSKERGLSALVLTRSVLDAPAREWVPPARFEELKQVDGETHLVSVNKFFIYDCNDFR